MCSKKAIEIDNLSKQYRLGFVGTGTLKDDLNRWWHLVRGKEDPYLKIGETNVRSSGGNSDYVWALKDINFSVNEGEVLGIIGKNGAGKSTLLKILSRVTGPTVGEIRYNGRLAALLEVGTGFHAELTGRENIYLNGTLLGMSKAEVDAKIDEIIDFAGVARYVDTPVKRYSSGMSVRLGFAVAAHLEPDILVVDEVLAVGDAEFQRKAVGKMKDVSKSTGRTVLFVSHNMASVKALCTKCIVLSDGTVAFEGETNEAVDFYLKRFKSDVESNEGRSWPQSEAPAKNGLRLDSVELLNPDGSKVEHLFTNSDFKIKLNYSVTEENLSVGSTIRFFTEDDILLFISGSATDENWAGERFPVGKYSSECLVKGNLLNSGVYRIEVSFGHAQSRELLKVSDVLKLDLEDAPDGRGANFTKARGFFRPIFDWETKQV